ncbi:PrsW family intramembrane metalloprotease [Cryobacterium sp. TMT1-21]|uniref:PrsW family intramembrane metalloprotease n=1 Tax=Cryobacterium shii TaxID=1259235 RepID=A0AAQ2HGF7_9MICO|nr:MULTISPECIES: PrsW family intramembrane metalloprotease [Cryobacterium]TFC51285.1 PrsW family intramembrane metalloprotease [Cryobacterium shii]TFC85202.1 PrsW family intramembrane metalloprotease [Cryobacterium sp. TmT2-59]TFD13123.1 PrsW family intramembrane metalloprotease [Cryobacterium sp. TMT1-21]TFD20551.1 PrsW family intramembrane metalloprotease [Cryobacterium sp. TMT4-10]TFD26215.1 PrsW family intramembrane metalloprotease [Cryobacterium sp. TMT2-23]
MTFESPESRPAAAAPGVQPAAQPVQPVWSAPVRRTSGGLIALTSVGLVVGGTAVLLVLVYLATFLGPGALLICLILALIPLTAILLAVRWIDRWEPEPRPTLWFALLWGAGVSVASALIFDLGVQIALNLSGASRSASGSGADFTAAVIQAPIVEETAKGFGILLIFWVLRRRFDGPVDGIVFAATVAAGFAFSENIQYFGLAMMDGGAANLGFTFLVRGVLSPFAHVMFTACTGIAIGLAARRRGAAAAGTILLGLLGAILLHMLWNGAFYLVDSASLVTYYLLVQVPLFLAAVVVVILLRRQEKRITERRLSEYAAVGWFSAAEVSMLATPEGRRQARTWASRQPRARKRAMQSFIRDATRLAFARQRMLNGTAGHVDRADEAELLGLIQADRAGVIA